MCTQQDDSTSTIKYFILADFQSYPHPSTYSVFNYYFACYTSQWITVTGFLPSMYVEHGIDLKVTGILVSIVVLANLGGTFGAGILLQRGWKPKTLFSTGFTAMLCSSFLAFAASSWLMFDLQFISAVLFSLIGGIIPTTVFAITLQHARMPMPQQPVLNFCAAFERSTGFDHTELGLYRGRYRQPFYIRNLNDLAFIQALCPIKEPQMRLFLLLKA